MPMLKDKIGGTWSVVANSELDRRIVPSPPNVQIKSTLSWNVGSSTSLLGKLVYIGKGSVSWISSAVALLKMSDVSG